jgi:uncharacterized protein involved in outer membrane biogenesis
MKMFTRALVVVSVIVLGALSAIVVFADAELLGRQLVGTLETATGRDVTLGGNPHVHLGLQPVLELSDLTIAGADGASPLLTVETFSTRMDLRAVLRGQLLLTNIDLKNVDVNFAKGDRALLARLVAGGETSGPQLEVHSASLTNVSVTVANGETTRTFALETLTGKLHDGLEFEAVGTFEGQTLGVTGHMNSPSDNGQRRVSIDLATTDLKVKGAGSLHIGEPTAKLELAVAVEAPSAKFTSDLTLTGEALTLDEIQGKALGTDFTGTVTINALASRPTAKGTVWFERLDLSSSESGTAPQTVPIPAEIQISAGVVALPNLTLEGVRAKLVADGNNIVVDQIQANVAGGQLSGKISKSGVGAEMQLASALRGNRIHLAQLPALAAIHDEVQGTLNVQVDIQAKGASEADWRASASGTVRAMLDDGRARAAGVELLIGGVHKLFDTFSAGSADWVELNCAAVDFELASGIATSRLLVIDSKHASVVGGGTIDIAAQTLSLEVTPRPKSATLNLSVPVRISGPIDAPTFALDEAAAARRAGGLLASALVFPPAIILTFADLGVDDSGCVGAYVLEGQDRATSFIGTASEVLGTATEAVGETVSSSGKHVEKAAGKAADVAGETISDVGKEIGKAAETLGKSLGKSLGKLFGD